jgi:hypothetical protein
MGFLIRSDEVRPMLVVGDFAASEGVSRTEKVVRRVEGGGDSKHSGLNWARNVSGQKWRWM